MSTVSPCSACQMGDHDNHVEHWLVAPPGVLGGAQCLCPGDCLPPELLGLFGATSASEPSTDAESAWLAYRDQYQREHPWADSRRTGRQTRKREFIAGYAAGLAAGRSGALELLEQQSHTWRKGSNAWIALHYVARVLRNDPPNSSLRENL